MTESTYEGWTILELMGHRRLAGYVRIEEIAGQPFLRLDVPSGCTALNAAWCPVCGDCRCERDIKGLSNPDCPLHAKHSLHGNHLVATQYYSASAIYCVTPTTEEMARAVAARAQPAPVQRWELPRLEQRRKEIPPSNEEDDDGDYDPQG